jgi:hypothetical protein
MGGDELKIYIAAPWEWRSQAKLEAEKFIAEGHEITHAWWDNEIPDLEPEKMVEQALKDFMGVGTADIFVLMNMQPRGHETSGKAVETGIAILALRAQGFPLIYAIGERYTNIFHYLPEVEWRESIEEILNELK